MPACTLNIMIAALCLIASVLGAALAFLVLKPRLSNAEKAAAVERANVDSLETARRQLEVDLAIKTAMAARVEELQAKIDQGAERITCLEREKSSLATSISEREVALSSERAQFEHLKDEFRAQFAELSIKALTDNSEAFLNTAKRVLSLQQQEASADLGKRQEEITKLVKPLQDGIKAVSDAAREMEEKREITFGKIEEQLRASVIQGAEVARQTGSLKDALKKPHVRGRWGEVQLQNCIDLAGMDEHCDVEFQKSSITLEEEVIRPDMVVRMPGGRMIAVDAKTPMDGFLQYVEATTDEERAGALNRHGRAVKNHVANLTKVNYMGRLVGSPDFVVMFLPNESFFAMALEREPTLMEDALANKVLITTPSTLIGLLKVVRYGWNEQRLAENAQQIADEGAKLNTQITYFLEDFAKVGSAIKLAADAYGNSRRRLQSQIVRSSGKLSELGAKSKRPPKEKAVRFLGVQFAAEEVENHLPEPSPMPTRGTDAEAALQ